MNVAALAVFVPLGLASDTFLSPFTAQGFYWAVLSFLVSLTTTEVPVGEALTSAGDVIDVAGIATVGPLPIALANAASLMIGAAREGGERVKRLPYNLTVWLSAPFVAGGVFGLFGIEGPAAISLSLAGALVLTHLVYSFVLVSEVSMAIAATEGLPFWFVLKHNYAFPELVSIASIPITIVAVSLWWSQGAIGPAMLALPLLMLGYGTSVAFERLRLAERIRRESQLAEFGKVAASVMHEVGRPLSRIVATADQAISGGRPQEEALSDILDWAKSTSSETSRILGAFQTGLQHEIVLVSELIADLVSHLDAGSLKRVKFSQSRALESLVRCDRIAIVLGIQNLVINALEASEEAEVRVGCESVESSGRLLGRKGEDRISFIVEDDGPGLSSETQDKIFEPLYTTKAAGRGIGLFLSRQIANAHGGDLIGFNRSSRGARFELTIPLSKRP